MRRRLFLAGTATAGISALAGCSGIFENLARRALGDVNVTNNTDQEVTISVVIEDTDGTVVLEESVTLSPSGGGDGNGDNQPSEQFNNVWSSGGEYVVTADVEGGVSRSKTVTIESTDNALLVVYTEDGIEIQRFSEAADETPTATS